MLRHEHWYQVGISRCRPPKKLHRYIPWIRMPAIFTHWGSIIFLLVAAKFPPIRYLAMGKIPPWAMVHYWDRQQPCATNDSTRLDFIDRCDMQGSLCTPFDFDQSRPEFSSGLWVRIPSSTASSPVSQTSLRYQKRTLRSSLPCSSLSLSTLQDTPGTRIFGIYSLRLCERRVPP